jgi:hypothetical protein
MIAFEQLYLRLIVHNMYHQGSMEIHMLPPSKPCLLNSIWGDVL